MKKLIPFLFLILFSCSHHSGGDGHAQHHRFDDAQKWEKVFENKKRDEWQLPEKVISSLKLKSHHIIADIGSATGYFPVRLSKVLKKGRVWGVDIEPNMVSFLNRRAQKEGLNNVFSILGTFDDPLIPEKTDFILIVDTYHHIDKRASYFENLKNYLKKDGKLVIIDFKKGDLPFGPRDEMKLSHTEVTNELTSFGYQLKMSYDFLPYQYMLVFQK